MERREFLKSGLAAAVCFGAFDVWAAAPPKEQLQWLVRIKGWLCPGCGRTLQGRLAALPSVVSAKVDVKKGDVEVITADTRATEKLIRETIEKTKFKVISIKGPIKVKR
jgi:copper chaperone CopZ